MRISSKLGQTLWEGVISAVLLHERVRSSVPLLFLECTCESVNVSQRSIPRAMGSGSVETAANLPRLTAPAHTWP